MADGQAVERPHLHGVEKHGPVAYPRALVSHELEVGQVGGDHPEGMAAVEFLQQCLGDGAA